MYNSHLNICLCILLVLGNVITFRVQLQRTLVKPGGNHSLSALGGGTGIHSVGLQKHVFYSGPVSIGTPPQTLQALFDTGSAPLWFYTTKCDPKNLGCKLHKHYDHSKSSSYKANGTSHKFGWPLVGRTVFGIQSAETITVAGLQVKNQTFLEATALIVHPSSLMRKLPWDGVFGLDFPFPPENTVFRSTFFTMWKQGVVKNPVFCLYCNKNTSAEVGGELAFGQCNEKHYTEPFVYTERIPMVDWFIIIEKGWTSDAVAPPCLTQLDTGSAVFSLPKNILASVLKSTGVAVEEYSPDDLGYVVNCTLADTMGTIYFQISGTKFSLEPEYYVEKIKSSKPNADKDFDDFEEMMNITSFILYSKDEHSNGQVRCVAHLSIGMFNADFGIGDPFFRKYYTLFDMGNLRLGFALGK